MSPKRSNHIQTGSGCRKQTTQGLRTGAQGALTSRPRTSGVRDDSRAAVGTVNRDLRRPAKLVWQDGP
jgi:hypothetical protein